MCDFVQKWVEQEVGWGRGKKKAERKTFGFAREKATTSTISTK
jgi:hypothetical protein